MAITSPEPACPEAVSNAQSFVIVLDPGHDPEKGGALSATGEKEVFYNDRLAEAIKKALETMTSVKLTRNPGEVLGLHERSETANRLGAHLFISVHHDSAQEKYLKRTDDPKSPRVETIVPIRGFSIFVSGRNSEYDRSLEFARLLGRELRRTGRSPSLHHAEKIAGENRPVLDAELGLYRFDELLVLRESQSPAILFEAGVIVDPVDEQFVSDRENISQTARAIKKAVAEFIESARH